MRSHARLLIPLVFWACSDSTGTAPVDLTLSGTITLPASLASSVVIVGQIPGSVGGLATDGADSIISANGTWGNTPQLLPGSVTIAGGATSRTYAFTLPTNPDGFGWLVAFVDLNGNGMLDLLTEPTRFPKKVIEGNTIVVKWATTSINGTGTYYVDDGGSKTWTLSVAGRSGFNFSF